MSSIQQLAEQNIDIRPLMAADLNALARLTNRPLSVWNTYLQEHEAGERFTCVVTKENQLVGYGSLCPESNYPLFEKEDVFEISDLWIAPTQRRHGLATLLVTYFESIAQDEEAAYIGIGIGLTAESVPAHCLCIRLGYLPDQAGMTYKGLSVVLGNQYPVDQDLRLWFMKDLSAEELE